MQVKLRSHLIITTSFLIYNRRNYHHVIHPLIHNTHQNETIIPSGYETGTKNIPNECRSLNVGIYPLNAISSSTSAFFPVRNPFRPLSILSDLISYYQTLFRSADHSVSFSFSLYWYLYICININTCRMITTLL